MTAVPHWDLAGPADTDADLARAAAAGDRGAFAGIYDRYADRLHDFCVGMLRDRDDAADCVQDAFCIAATRLSQLRDADKLRPWLYAIARNEALRRLRDRRRETVSDELPEIVSVEPGPETLAARTELADLISEAAGGLSDRDRSILELAYRHGLDGPDLAEALGVSSTNATKMVYRLRDTIERALGALLVARRVRNTGNGCSELASILDCWDGHFTVLMRKRISRHIESCPICDEERHRLVSPVALLGSIPVFIPAPASLRERTLGEIQLTSSATPVEPDEDAPEPDASASGQPQPVAVEHADDVRRRRTRRLMLVVALLAATLIASLGLTIAWQYGKNTTVAPADTSGTATEPSAAPSETPSPTPSNPIPEPPTAPPASTTPVSVPPVAEPPQMPPADDPVPPRRPVDPEPPVAELPVLDTPPVSDPPDLRGGPSTDLPNDAVTPRNGRTQPPAGIAGIPPPQTADEPTRRANNPPPKPPTRRAINSTGSQDPPR